MEKILFTSESVTEGHPDKICDAVSDAILDAMIEQDPMSRVACETATCTGFVLITGEITTKANVDIQDIARKSLKNIATPSGKSLDEQLIQLIGSDFNLARALAAKEISDLEGLAELDVDELSDVPQLTAKEAGDLIMAARNLTWFKDDASN